MVYNMEWKLCASAGSPSQPPTPARTWRSRCVAVASNFTRACERPGKGASGYPEHGSGRPGQSRASLCSCCGRRGAARGAPWPAAAGRGRHSWAGAIIYPRHAGQNPAVNRVWRGAETSRKVITESHPVPLPERATKRCKPFMAKSVTIPQGGRAGLFAVGFARRGTRRPQPR